MAEAIILSLATSIAAKIAHLTGDAIYASVSERLKASKCAKKDLVIIAEYMHAICAVVEDAEQRQYTNKAIKIWLRDLKSLAYEIDDQLDEVAFDALERRVDEGHFRWYDKIRYSIFPSNPTTPRSHFSRNIKDLLVELEHIVDKKNKFGLTERPIESSRDEIRDELDVCRFVHERAAIGRDEAKQDIINEVLRASYCSTSSQPCILPIVGMGGIGKTTLAKLVHRDISSFDLKLWVCVSDRFQIHTIVENILKNAGFFNTSNQSLDTLLSWLKQLLEGKKYFLVLDDVWAHDYRRWGKLQNILTNGMAGNTILVTTREANVASITQTTASYDVDRLPDHVCWDIFQQLAFREGEEGRYYNLYLIGWSIVQKCCGVPLLVESLGSSLRSVRDEDEWDRINTMGSFRELDEQYTEVIEVLRVSYNKLPSHLKPLFALMSLFMKDTNINLDIQYLWSALGLLRLRNENNEFHKRAYLYLKEMASRSLIQEPNLEIEGAVFNFQMHDLLHDLSASILGEELAIVTWRELKVSKFTRHIVWGYEDDDSLCFEEFPEKLLQAKNSRTFRFGYILNRHISSSFLESMISTFVCLRFLDLGYSLFEVLPSSIGNLKLLRYLNLAYNCVLKSLPDTICKLLNLECLWLNGCTELEELPKDVYLLHNLMVFAITTKMSSLDPRLIEMSSLQKLAFQSCENLEPLWDNGYAARLPSLQSLIIKDCPQFTCLPNSKKFLKGLEILRIADCENMYLSEGKGLKSLTSLRQLAITRLPMLTTLPVRIKYAASSLEYLHLIDCENLTFLPNCLKRFTSIRIIRIGKCPNLQSLPKVFHNLTSLQKLSIWKCQHLSEKCAVPTGEYYSFIQHIPLFKLDGVCYTPCQSE